MACPFLRDPVDLGAIIIRAAIQRERVLRDRQDPLSFSDDFLYERYRFSRQGIIYLQKLIGPHIENATRRGRALTVTQTLCLGLRFFASGSFLYSVGGAENISKSTVCRSVRKVYLALKTFLKVFIKFPGHVGLTYIKEGFYGIAAFPNVIGAVDCTQILIQAPSGPHQGDYMNLSGFHSINVQMICDSTCLITNIEAKWPGSVHKSRIFRESALCHRFEQGHYDGLLIGDRGYACRPFLMTPYPEPEPGPQTRFNRALGKTRAPIEMTFGQIKGRFTCLQGLRVAPDRACDIIAACAVLHNIATIRKERGPLVAVPPDEHMEPLHLDEPTGPAARDEITTKYFC